jgi:hypothetical protein
MRRTRSVRRPICAIKVSPSTTRVTLAWRLNHAGAASELRAAGRPSCVVAVAVMNPASAAKRSRPNFRKLTPVHLARSHVSDEPTRGRRRPAPSPASLVEPSPQRHRNTMTSQGTPHGRFQRAIHARHLQNAEMAGREMGGLSLADALRLCELLANTDPAVRSERRCDGSSGSLTSGCRRSPRWRLLRQLLRSFGTAGETSALRRLS